MREPDIYDTIQFYSKYSEQYDVKHASLNNYNQTYVDFINNAGSKHSLLDLACGPGNVAKFIKNYIPEIAVTGVDLSPEMLSLAKEKIKDATFYQSDIIELAIPEQTYGLICCAFGLPYIKPDQIADFVTQIDRYSEKGTSVYISCMQGNKSQAETISFGGDEKILIHYHSKEKIVDHFSNNGFKMVDYKELDYKEPDGSITIDMVIVFEKQ